MNKRLVWNFEINNESLLILPTDVAEEPELLKWEARYFWEEESLITLRGLNDTFLDLSLYKIKQRQDRYYLISNQDFNVKQRRNELLYKPLIENSPACQGFGKKITLSNHSSLGIIPGIIPIDSDSLRSLIHFDSTEIYVEKTALIYKFAIEPRIKLELARLKITDKIYYSVCIEGTSKKLVTYISKHLLNQDVSCGYVAFLKTAQGIT
jgi:hypothetical protein